MTQVTKKRGRPARVGPPPYCLHKFSGHAYVHIGGEDCFLGKHNSPESLEKDSRLVAELAAGAVIVHGQVATVEDGLTIAEIAVAYLKHARKYYVKNGNPNTRNDLPCLSHGQTLIAVHKSCRTISHGRDLFALPDPAD